MQKKSSFCPFDGKTRKALVSALLTDPKACNWSLEMKMTKTLAKKLPDPQFWFFLAKSYKFSTLISLLAQKELIFKQILEYTKQTHFELKTAPEIKLADKNLGQDIITEKPQQTLLDFVK